MMKADDQRTEQLKSMAGEEISLDQLVEDCQTQGKSTESAEILRDWDLIRVANNTHPEPIARIYRTKGDWVKRDHIIEPHADSLESIRQFVAPGTRRPDPPTRHEPNAPEPN
jgi:hypothetical protein